MKTKLFLFAGWVSANPRFVRFAIVSTSAALLIVAGLAPEGSVLADGMATGGPH